MGGPIKIWHAPTPNADNIENVYLPPLKGLGSILAFL